MLQILNNLDKKNKLFNNLALLPGFHFLDVNPDSLSKKQKLNNEIYELDCLIGKDKPIIDDTLFAKFYDTIDTTEKKQTTRKRRSKNKKTRRK